MKRKNWLVSGAALVVGCAGSLMACGGPASLDGLGGGDYVVFRVSSGTSKQDGNCGAVDPNHVETTNLRNGSTFLVYGVDNSDGTTDYYLDNGAGGVLPGAVEDDGSYKFSFTDTTVDTNGTTQTTTKITDTVTLTPNGSDVAGTNVEKLSETCAGPCGGFQPTTCTISTGFTGVQIDDASVDVSLASK